MGRQKDTIFSGCSAVLESINLDATGIQPRSIIRTFAIVDAKPFYRSIEFVETNGSGEMILTITAGDMLLSDLEQRRRFNAGLDG